MSVKPEGQKEGEDKNDVAGAEDPDIDQHGSGGREEDMETGQTGQTRRPESSDSEDESWSRPWKMSSSPHHKPVPKQKVRIPQFHSSWSTWDTQQYRMGYPGKEDNLSLTANYEFYMNKRPSYPEGDYIDAIHIRWWGNYRLLESHHGYIQWLFPIRESGMNYFSQELQLHEIKNICSSPEAHARVLKSYQMMLDFYGMRMKDSHTGELERTDNWRRQFHNLNYSSHNFLRVTRILKSLGELKYEHLKAPFIRFVLQEALVHGTLSRTVESCMQYWVEVVKDDEERRAIREWAEQLAGSDTPPHSDSENSDSP